MKKYPSHHRHHRGSKKYFGALILIVIGGIMLVNRLPIALPSWLFSWKSIVIIIGLLIGLRHRFKGWVWFGLILLGAAFILVDNYVPSAYQDFVFPVGIILLGLFIFVSKLLGHQYWQRRAPYCENPGVRDRQAKQTASISDEDTIKIDNFFGGIKRSFISKELKGGHIRNVFGGSKVNLTQCDFGEAVNIRVNNVFGGVKLIIPSDWQVVANMETVFGGVDDKTNLDETETAKKCLTLEGELIFGGIEIDNF